MGKLRVRRFAWRAATLGREGRGGRSISSVVEVWGGKGASGEGPWWETGSSMGMKIDQRGLWSMVYDQGSSRDRHAL